MKRTSAWLAMFVALGCSVLAASASAAKVPGFLLLAGESGTLVFNSTPKDELVGGIEQNKIKTELQSAVGLLTAEGLLVKITLNSDDEGTFEELQLLVKTKAAVACSTPGDAAGEVLVSGKVRLVHDITSASGNGILFEPGEVTVTCAAEKVHVKGTVLGLIKGTGTKEGEDFKQWLLDVLCKNTSGGEPLEEKFWGLSGVEEKAKLEANFGTGFKKACKLVFSEVELNSNKMTELMEVG